MNTRSLTLFALTCLLFLILQHDFLSLTTWATIFTSSADIGVVVIGVTYLMIAGEFDLSVGSNLALSGMIFAYTSSIQSPSLLSLVLALGTGSLIGLINGLLTLTLNIPSFIVTLSMMLACRGLVLLLSNGFPIFIEQPNTVMSLLGADVSHGILMSFVWFIMIGFYLHFVIKMTKSGNHLQATGLNTRIAKTMGIHTSKVKLLAFVICGALAALAGVMQVGHLNSLSPTAGEQYELYAIAAAVIGGNSLKGGTGSILGAMLGILLINVIDTGLIQAGVSIYWYRMFLAVLLIATATLNLKSQTITFKHKQRRANANAH